MNQFKIKIIITQNVKYHLPIKCTQHICNEIKIGEIDINNKKLNIERIKVNITVFFMRMKNRFGTWLNSKHINQQYFKFKVIF